MSTSHLPDHNVSASQLASLPMSDFGDRLRTAAFVWLSQQTDGGLLPIDFQTLKRFAFEGNSVSLIGQRGIWKPRQLTVPISIATAPPRGAREAPYEDSITDGGLLRYRYQGTDPETADNVGLRRAMVEQLPLIYFFGIARGVYHATWPVYVVEDQPEELSILVAMLEPGRVRPDLPSNINDQAERRYYERMTRQRIHQSSFRVHVLSAYREKCAMCRLNHPELLDAAHIIPDSEGGRPHVPNGMALCKIHHAAFDEHIVGVCPDKVIEIRGDILEEVDGPMLRHGLQELHRQRLHLPRSTDQHPATDLLEQRYEQFQMA